MILITQFWNFENPKRKEEIYDCLLKNSRNRYINKIYVFSENGSYIKFQHNKIVPLKADHRLTYFEMFKTVNQNFKNQLCIVANADVYFDESIVKLNQVDFNNKIIALSSYDSETKLPEVNSYDSWVMKSINLPYNEFELGKSNDDLRVVKNLMDNDIEILNPAKEVFSYHVDSKKKLKYNDLPDGLIYIEPSMLNNNIRQKTTVIPEDKIIEIKEEPKVVKKVIEKKPIINKPVSKSVILNKKKIIDTQKELERVNNVKKILKRTKSNIKIAVHLHLYYQDLWDEFSAMFKNLNSYDYDIYVTLTNGSSTIGQTNWIKSKIESEFENVTIIEVENKGLDIGAFLSVLKNITSSKKEYDYLLKLHTKKSVKTAGVEFGENWRKQLYKPLVGSDSTVKEIIQRMENNHIIGMIGNSSWISDFQGLNKNEIDELKNILNIKTTSKKFIGGTMFWVRYSILEKYFNEENLDKISMLLENGYFTDYENGTYTHALERILGYIVPDSNKIIEGV